MRVSVQVRLEKITRTNGAMPYWLKLGLVANAICETLERRSDARPAKGGKVRIFWVEELSSPTN